MPDIGQVKVLIIDDEHAIANTLSLVLNQEGFRTCTAYSGEEGIHIAESYQPDILISDVFMGGITGIAAAIEVRARVPSCDVLLLSGNVSNAKQLWDPLDGEMPFEILSKPIHPLDLLAKLRKFGAFIPKRRCRNMSLGDSGARSRTIWRRLVTGGPYVNEAMSLSILSTIILVGLGVIALADHSVSSFPLASLYILPLTLCALVYPFRVTLVLCFGCWMLHDFVSPFRESGFHQHVLRGGTTLLGYLGVVGVVHGLGAQRRRAAELAMTQRDELAAEIQLGAEV